MNGLSTSIHGPPNLCLHPAFSVSHMHAGHVFDVLHDSYHIIKLESLNTTMTFFLFQVRMYCNESNIVKC